MPFCLIFTLIYPSVSEEYRDKDNHCTSQFCSYPWPWMRWKPAIHHLRALALLFQMVYFQAFISFMVKSYEQNCDVQKISLSRFFSNTEGYIRDLVQTLVVEWRSEVHNIHSLSLSLSLSLTLTLSLARSLARSLSLCRLSRHSCRLAVCMNSTCFCAYLYNSVRLVQGAVHGNVPLREQQTKG